MKIYTLIIAVSLVASVASAESRFVRFDLPLHVSIEVPQNWWMLSGDINTTIEAAGEAATKLAEVDLPSGKKVNLLRANSMPRSTYASIAINATDSDISPAEVRSLSKSDLEETELYMAEAMGKVLAAQNLKFLELIRLEKNMVSGHIAIVFDYRRSGPNGPVVVSMTRLFIGSKEISFNLSYREAEGPLWKPVIEYMKQSIIVENKG